MHRFMAAVAGIACCACSVPVPPPQADWNRYQQAYLSAQGRIVDTGNGGISHSEGQGIGMLLAAHYHDRAAFDLIWLWTRDNLQIRGDGLAGWKWVPQAGDGAAGSLADRNNATDGDLFIAWALCRAGWQWNDASYLEAARAIARAIHSKLVVPSAYGPVLLPGADGFLKNGVATVNLSYWIFPALRDLDRLDPSLEWPKVTASGLSLLQAARFGRWQLPPDWLQLSPALAPAPDFKPRFGYDAVRIPLYLVWAKLDDANNLKSFNDFWGYFEGARFVPAWTQFSDDSIDSYDASPGMLAVTMLTRCRAAGTDLQRTPFAGVDAAKDYYAASLLLLAKVAAQEGPGK
jgi:endoglucanase